MTRWKIQFQNIAYPVRAENEGFCSTIFYEIRQELLERFPLIYIIMEEFLAIYEWIGFPTLIYFRQS